ncbi:hypothetical protein MMPV_006641 [Pyropia vietnamensis]
MDALGLDLADAKAKHATALGGSSEVVAGLLVKLTTMAAELDAYAAHGPATDSLLSPPTAAEGASSGGGRGANGTGPTATVPPDAPLLASLPTGGAAAAANDAGALASPAGEAMETVSAARAAKAVLTAHQRTVHGAIGRLARRVDDTFPANPETAVAPNIRLEQPLLDTAVAAYLVEAGHAGVAAALVEEAGLSAAEVGLPNDRAEPVNEEPSVGFVSGGGTRLCAAAAEVLDTPPSLTQLARLLSQLRTGDTEGCVHWGVAHYRALRMTAVGNRLLFKLHSLAFLGFAARGDVGRALRYARKQLAPYGTMLQRELERLMGAFFVLICAAPPLEEQAAATAAAVVAAAAARKATAAKAAAAVPGEVLPPSSTAAKDAAESGPGGGAAAPAPSLAAKDTAAAVAPADKSAGAAGASPAPPPPPVMAHPPNGGRPLPPGHDAYLDLLDGTLAAETLAAFESEYRRISDLPAEPLLAVAVNAGAAAIPAAIKAARLPLNAEMRSELSGSAVAAADPAVAGGPYHTVFSCPVSRAEATPDNPPKLLPCGHVLAKESVERIRRTHSHFKCPYCPRETSEALCRVINL